MSNMFSPQTNFNCQMKITSIPSPTMKIHVKYFPFPEFKYEMAPTDKPIPSVVCALEVSSFHICDIWKHDWFPD